MAHSVLSRGAAVETSQKAEELIRAYRVMLQARVLDEKFASLYRGGKIHGGVFLGRGQEALSACMGLALKKGDIFAPLIRDAAGRLAFCETVLDAARTYLGSSLGPMRGRDGNVHRGKPREGYLPMISHLGAMISVVTGCLMAHRFQGITGTVGMASIGEGATSTGAFHEALNQAAVEKLPLVLVVANNQYAYSTPTARQFACESLRDRAAGYGIEDHGVDGTDLAGCSQVINDAVARARAGHGPQLVIARLLRLCGHGEHDDSSYIDPKLKTSPLGRDCIKIAEELLASKQFATSADLELWRNEAIHNVEEAIAKVQREPAPDPYVEEWTALSTSRLRESGEGQ